MFCGPNLCLAVECARSLGAFTVSLTGRVGKDCSALADICLRVHGADPRVDYPSWTDGFVIGSNANYPNENILDASKMAAGKVRSPSC
jgi:hypothetical protein